MRIKPLDMLDLYLSKGLIVVYADGDRSRLGLAGRRDGVTVIDMSKPYPEDAIYDSMADLAILVYSNEWLPENLRDLPLFGDTTIFVFDKVTHPDGEDNTEEDHGWEETKKEKPDDGQ